MIKFINVKYCVKHLPLMSILYTMFVNMLIEFH